MSTRLCNVMRLALDSSRLGILRGVIVSSRLGVPRSMFKRGHGDIGMSTTSGCRRLVCWEIDSDTLDAAGTVHALVEARFCK